MAEKMRYFYTRDKDSYNAERSIPMYIDIESRKENPITDAAIKALAKKGQQIYFFSPYSKSLAASFYKMPICRITEFFESGIPIDSKILQMFGVRIVLDSDNYIVCSDFSGAVPGSVIDLSVSGAKGIRSGAFFTMPATGDVTIKINPDFVVEPLGFANVFWVLPNNMGVSNMRANNVSQTDYSYFDSCVDSNEEYFSYTGQILLDITDVTDKDSLFSIAESFYCCRWFFDFVVQPVNFIKGYTDFIEAVGDFFPEAKFDYFNINPISDPLVDEFVAERLTLNHGKNNYALEDCQSFLERLRNMPQKNPTKFARIVKCVSKEDLEGISIQSLVCREISRTNFFQLVSSFRYYMSGGKDTTNLKYFVCALDKLARENGIEI